MSLPRWLGNASWEWLHAALFDGMGHDIPSTLMTTLAMGVYRHARRTGAALDVAHAAVDAAIAKHWEGEAFVTGLLLRLQAGTGTLEWTTAGHPAPLLMRERRVIGELAATPCLPFGFGDPCSVAREQLHPGDSLLLFTDGVVEGRTPQGEEFGTERLMDLWERESLPERPAEEVARRLTQAIIDHQVGKLHDDSTLMVVQWRGRGA